VSFHPASKTGSDVADLMSLGSLFQTEVAATTKAWSPIEGQVAGMTSKDDAAERRCFQPNTKAKVKQICRCLKHI